MLASAAGEFAAALNMFGTMPNADLICASCSPVVPVALDGSIRVILDMFFPFIAWRGGIVGPVMAVAGPTLGSVCGHDLAGQAEIAGRDLEDVVDAQQRRMQVAIDLQ